MIRQVGRWKPRLAIVIVSLGLCWAGRADGQEGLEGTWRGDLATPLGAVTLVVALDGKSAGSVAVPARGVAGIPVIAATLAEGGAVTFEVPADQAAFEGRLASSTLLVGDWLQAGQRIPLELERIGGFDDAPVARARRQTPQPPFPYLIEEITVATEERLACTITRPRVGDRRTPGAVLLTVAGPNDRDQTHSGHKPYMVLADHLTRTGVAVIRCDDRGVGRSSGDLSSVTMDDLAADAMALVRTLANREGIGPVGVIGNSEGSVVGSLAAVAAPDEVAFVILLGGVGVPGAELIRERLVAQAVASGRSQREAETMVSPFDALAELVREAGGAGIEEVERSRPELYQRYEAIAREAGQEDPFLPTDPEERMALFAGAWYHAQLTLDGGAILENVQAPVLALTGSKDRTNLPAQNLPAIREALDRGGNADYHVSEIPDLNHVFQTAVVGGMTEYGTLEESFSPVALDLITRWILDRFGDQ